MKNRLFTGRVCGQLLAGLLLALTVAAARADYQATVLGDHPLAYYPLNSTVDPTGTTATDLSGNGNNGTYNGTDPEFNSVPGPSACLTNALLFDGFTSYVDLGTGANPSLLNFGGTISLEAWVQPASTTEGPADILAKGYDSAQSYDELVLRANAGNYYGGTYSSTNNVQGASGGQQSTNWAYVVCTYDGTHWNFYFNGVQAQSNPDPVGAINFSDPWRIGTGSADGASRFFQGNITQVALYSNALSSDQVLAHYFMGEVGVMPSNSVPLITTQPQPQSAYSGGTVTFTVGCLSVFPTTNQWYKDGNPLSGQTNASLTLTNVQAGDIAGYSVRIGNSNGVTNSTSASLTLLTAGNSLQWSAGANTGVWDAGNSANWLNVSNDQQSVFNTGDQVLFDDTVGAPTNVAISGPVEPSLITVNAGTNNFTFSDGGSGQIAGVGSLLKEGAGTLTLNVPGGFTGTATIAGGTLLTAGNNTLSSVSSILATNGGTLDFDGNAMAGNKPVTISGAGVNGGGALVNSAADIYGNVLNITLAGDAVIGGSGRWDLAAGSTIAGAHKLILNRATSGTYGEWDTVTIATNVGDIELATGKLGIKNMGASFGNPNSTLIVDPGFECDFWSGSGYGKNIHVLTNGLVQILTALNAFDANVTLEDGARWSAFWGSGDLPMNGAFTLNGVAHIVLGDANFIFTNVISGPGGFVWDAYNHQMILEASNTYSGPTIIGGGLTVALSGNGSISDSSLIFFGGTDPTAVRVDVSGRPDNTLTLAAGQTLAGIGTVAGNLVVSPGALLTPSGTNTTLGITTGANPAGTLAASGDVTLGGTTLIKLDGSGTNDVVEAWGNVAYGGTLELVNISGAPLAAGDSFQVFNATGYSGSFSSITPTSPGPGLAWDKSQLGSGILSVVAGATQPVINSSTVSGTNLVVQGTGGVANGTYYLLTATNLATPLTQWTVIATNSFDATGGFSVTNTVDAGATQRYFQVEIP